MACYTVFIFQTYTTIQQAKIGWHNHKNPILLLIVNYYCAVCMLVYHGPLSDNNLYTLEILMANPNGSICCVYGYGGKHITEGSR